MKTTFIYALCEPGTRRVRYIGKANDPRKRLKTHLQKSGSLKHENRLGRWLRKIGVPDLVILREVSIEDWQKAEERYIRLARGCHMDLVNSTDGGEGVHNPSPETLEKMSRPKSPEHRAAFSRAQKGKPKGPSHRAAIRASNIARCTGRSPNEAQKLGLQLGRKKHAGSASKFLGVHWDASRQKWNTGISINGKTFRFGRFENEIEAARARDTAAIKFYGPKAVLNFPNT